MDPRSFVWGILAGLGLAYVAVRAAIAWQDRRIAELRADAERHEEAEQVEAEEQRAAVLVALRKRGGLFGTPNVYEA